MRQRYLVLCTVRSWKYFQETPPRLPNFQFRNSDAGYIAAGLETFAQLIDWNDEVRAYLMWDVPLVVLDAPRFPWRYVPTILIRNLSVCIFDSCA